MKLIQQEFKSCEIPFNGKEWLLLYSHLEMSTPFYFIVFLPSFLIREARLPLYAVKKYLLNINQVSLFLVSCPLCRRSPPSCSLFQASKTLKNKSSPRWTFKFHAALLPRIWNIYYYMFQWWFRWSIDVIFYCFRGKSPTSVTKVPPLAGCYFEPCCEGVISVQIFRRRNSHSFFEETLLLKWINRVGRFDGFPWNLVRTFTDRYKTKTCQQIPFW